MHVPKIKVKYLCAPLLAVFLASSIIVALPHKATAQGETYEWFSNSIRANGGRFQSPPVTPVLDSAQTPNTPVNFTFLLGNQEETTSIWIGAQNIQYRQATCTINFTITITRVEEGSSGGVIRATGADPSVCDQLVDEYNASLDPVTIQGQPSPLAVEGTIPTPQDEIGSAEACSESSGELGFLLCPMSNLFMEIATWIDERIMELLYINASRIFNTPDSSENEQQSSEAMYTAWKIFRNIAYVLLLLLGLVMVVSQLLGMELFDAYAIRKMLPRIVIAAIIMPLLWPILRFLTIMFNDAGEAAMQLITSPFNYIGQIDPEAHNILALGAGVVASLLTIIGGTAGVGVGLWFFGGGGVILAVVTGILIAVVQALVILTLRDLIFFVLVLVSAPAVVLSIFQPFEKGFTLWRRLLTGILLSIPAVAAVLAVTKVVAAIAYISHPNLGVIFATLVVIAGYFLFWRVLKSTDKVAGMIDGAASAVTGRAQKRLADYRNRTLKRNYGLWKQGNLENRFGRATRGLGLRVGAAQAASEATGTGTLAALRGKSKILEEGAAVQTAAAMIKRDDGKTSGNDDAHEALAEAGIGDRATVRAKALVLLRERKIIRYRAMGFTQEEAERKADEEAGRELDDIEKSFGGTIGSRSMAIASAMALMESNTSLRKENGYIDEHGVQHGARTQAEALEKARQIMRNLQRQGAFDNTIAAKIFTSNKARERAWAGFGAAMGYLTVDEEIAGTDKDMTTSEFLRAGIKGNSPGATIGQRWEGVEAVAPELRVALKEVGSEQDKIVEALATPIRVEVRTRARNEALLRGATEDEADALAEDAVRAAAEQIRKLALDRAKAQPSKDWEKSQDTFLDFMASFDAMYRYTPGVSQQSRDILRKEVASKDFTFEGITMTGEQWSRYLQSPQADPKLVEKYSQLLYSYTRQYQGGTLTPEQIAAQAAIQQGSPGEPPTILQPPAR